MSLLTLPFKLPFLPVSGVIAVAQILYDEAELQQHDPASVRRQLEEAEEAHRSGHLSARELADAEADAVRRVIQPQVRR